MDHLPNFEEVIVLCAVEWVQEVFKKYFFLKTHQLVKWLYNTCNASATHWYAKKIDGFTNQTSCYLTPKSKQNISGGRGASDRSMIR